MKTALVCIAKNEDHYIDEWIDYHTKLGFDAIFVYQNFWRYSGDKSKFSNVTWIEFDGYVKQKEAYNDFIDNRASGYDFAAFFDVDEFLCLKRCDNVKTFLKDYTDCCAVAVNWRMFGDNGKAGVCDGNYSLLGRFIRREPSFSAHIKTILNLKKSCKSAHFRSSVHFVDRARSDGFMVDVSKSVSVKGSRNRQTVDGIAQINHYRGKTFEEFKQKCARGYPDHAPDSKGYHCDLNSFNESNRNEVVDTTARDFYVSRLSQGQSFYIET